MPLRLCQQPGCPNPAHYRGRCPDHARTNEHQTRRAGHRIYRTARWQHTRRRILHNNPICAACNTTLATDVDHITPLDTGGEPYDPANLQPLCAQCHGRKTRAEQQTQGRLAGGGH